MISPRVRAKMYRSAPNRTRVIGRKGGQWRSGGPPQPREEAEEAYEPIVTRRVWSASAWIAGLLGLVVGFVIWQRRR